MLGISANGVTVISYEWFVPLITEGNFSVW